MVSFKHFRKVSISLNFLDIMKLLNSKRLSFIGHSLGGIIIRAALPHLTEFKNKMYTFMTLSTPHLGYMYNSSSLIDAGKY